jgi:hypothetical protein
MSDLSNREQEIIKSVATHVSREIIEGVTSELMSVQTPLVQPVVLVDAARVNEDAIKRGVPKNALYNVYSSGGGGGGGSQPKPATTVDLATAECNGAVGSVTAVDAPSSQVVITGSTKPLAVCIEGEKDFAEVYKCDSTTSNTIMIRTVLDHDTNTYTTSYFDLVLGAAWSGNPATDLVECSGSTLESDQTKLCDDNGEFLRWYVKDNGQPTGVSYDTDMAGAPYTVVGTVRDCTPEEPIPYDWACADRNCRVQNFTYTFDETQFISQEIVSSTGSGQEYVGQYVFATPADALSFYQMYSLMALPGARANAGGFLNYHPGFFVSGSYDGNVTVQVTFDISNTVVKEDAAVTCGFVQPIGEYATTAGFLASFWDPIVGAGPQVGGAFTIDIALYTGGKTPIQLLKYVDPVTGEVTDRALIYMPGFPDHLQEYVPGLGETVAAGLCPAVTPVPTPVVEIPNGSVIVNTAQLSALVGGNLVQSFSVKGLAGKTYDISFDGGTTYQIGIDGGDSWGEGNIEQLDISQVWIKPTNTGDTTFVHWETV